MTQGERTDFQGAAREVVPSAPVAELAARLSFPHEIRSRTRDELWSTLVAFTTPAPPPGAQLTCIRAGP